MTGKECASEKFPKLETVYSNPLIFLKSLSFFFDKILQLYLFFWLNYSLEETDHNSV